MARSAPATNSLQHSFSQFSKTRNEEEEREIYSEYLITLKGMEKRFGITVASALLPFSLGGVGENGGCCTSPCHPSLVAY